ncbi:MAG: hypothetical protein WBM54_02375 [Woeseia sp.]
MPARTHTALTNPVLGIASMSLLVAACNADRPAGAVNETALPTAATLGDQTIKAARDYLDDAPYAAASDDLGQRLLMQCRACHTLEQGAGHRLGPNLFGLFGRRVGKAQGFGYTAALKEADFVWTPRALDAWLAQPQQFLPGNAMAYGGLRYPEDRAALIASLIRQTSDPVAETESDTDEILQ